MLNDLLTKLRPVIEQASREAMRFYDVPEELPTLYDLLINTDALDLKQAAAAVIGAATTAI